LVLCFVLFFFFFSFFSFILLKGKEKRNVKPTGIVIWENNPRFFLFSFFFFWLEALELQLVYF